MPKNTRTYVKLAELIAGETIELDDGFTCRSSGSATVQEDEIGKYFICDDGKHYLDGQCDDGEHCVGVYNPRHEGQ